MRHGKARERLWIRLTTTNEALVLIDSDALSRALLAQCLSGQGWRVLEADEGDAGFELVLKHQPAAVVCSLRLPKRNGFKVCRSIREEPQVSNTRIVLMSVSQFANDRDSAFAAGADDYLVKPIEPSDLLRVLDKSGENGSAAETAKRRRKNLRSVDLDSLLGGARLIPTPGPRPRWWRNTLGRLRIGNQF